MTEKTKAAPQKRRAAKQTHGLHSITGRLTSLARKDDPDFDPLRAWFELAKPAAERMRHKSKWTRRKKSAVKKAGKGEISFSEAERMIQQGGMRHV